MAIVVRPCTRLSSAFWISFSVSESTDALCKTCDGILGSVETRFDRRRDLSDTIGDLGKRTGRRRGVVGYSLGEATERVTVLHHVPVKLLTRSRDLGGSVGDALAGVLELQPPLEPLEGGECLLNTTFERSVLELHLNDAFVYRAHAEVTALHT